MITINRNQIQNYPYHLVDLSPWPVLVSFSLLSLLLGAVMFLHGFNYGGTLLTLGFILTAAGMTLWFRDVVVESVYIGAHTLQVQKGLMIGFILFIISEVMVFFSVFWTFFHSALSPTIELGSSWPPLGFESIDPFGVPLINTILLLSSGAFVTWSHHSLISGIRNDAINGLIVTILLAVIFTGLQGMEYADAPFTITDSVYGSVFYASTGAHGLHVIIGTTFLTVCLIRMINYHYTNSHHLGFESGILYWHFVDVVWLFLYIVVYYWSGGDASGFVVNTPNWVDLFDLFDPINFILANCIMLPVRIYANASTEKRNLLDENRRESGIYRWFNRINGKSYIGSAKDLAKRVVKYYNHRVLTVYKPTMLIHRALLKHGHANFRFEVLEFCSEKELTNREQYFFDTLKPTYNILENAYNSLGFKHSNETKENLRNIQLEIHKSPEHIAKKILANPNSLKIQVTDILTQEVFNFNSLREAGLFFSPKLNFSSATIRKHFSLSLKNGSLCFNKYRITRAPE